jgi:hypothetical protein
MERAGIEKPATDSAKRAQGVNWSDAEIEIDQVGQLQQLSKDEMDQAFSNVERWTVRPIFILAIAILFAIVFLLTMMHEL